MAIIRSPRPENHFTIIENQVLRDQRLSYKARGILIYILSHVDNWRISAEDLAGKSTDGRTAVLSGLEELRTLGYIVTTRKQNADGKWTTESVAFDTPQKLPKSGFPTSVFPTSGNPTPLEEPSKNKHKDAEPKVSARNQSPIQQLASAYIENLPQWAVKPSWDQICGQMAGYLKNNDLTELMADVTELGKEGKALSIYDLQRIRAARLQIKPKTAPTPTSEEFDPRPYEEARAKAAPMPEDIKAIVERYRKQA